MSGGRKIMMVTRAKKGQQFLRRLGLQFCTKALPLEGKTQVRGCPLTTESLFNTPWGFGDENRDR